MIVVGFLAGLQLLVRKEAGIWALAAGRVGTSLTCPGTHLTPQPFFWQCPEADGERKPKEQGKMLPLNTSPAPRIPWQKDFSRQECCPDVPYWSTNFLYMYLSSYLCSPCKHKISAKISIKLHCSRDDNPASCPEWQFVESFSAWLLEKAWPRSSALYSSLRL